VAENAPGGAPKIEERGLAFHEFLETDSVFFPVRSGSAGVTGGVQQYVLDLGSGEATLRNIAEPLVWNIDRSAEEPEVARELRDELYSAFPVCPKGNYSLLLECEVRSRLGDYFYRLLVQ